MKPPSEAIPDRLVSVIADGLVIEIACDDERLEGVLVGVQRLLMSLDIELALMSLGSVTDLAVEHGAAEQVRRAAMRN